jgi:hypothetical protein
VQEGTLDVDVDFSRVGLARTTSAAAARGSGDGADGEGAPEATASVLRGGPLGGGALLLAPPTAATPDAIRPADSPALASLADDITTTLLAAAPTRVCALLRASLSLGALAANDERTALHLAFEFSDERLREAARRAGPGASASARLVAPTRALVALVTPAEGEGACGASPPLAAHAFLALLRAALATDAALRSRLGLHTAEEAGASVAAPAAAAAASAAAAAAAR